MFILILHRQEGNVLPLIFQDKSFQSTSFLLLTDLTFNQIYSQLILVVSLKLLEKEQVFEF